jgi:NAD-dependent dihydropyrimidine dehydrogenase PreA subunit
MTAWLVGINWLLLLLLLLLLQAVLDPMALTHRYGGYKLADGKGIGVNHRACASCPACLLTCLLTCLRRSANCTNTPYQP